MPQTRFFTPQITGETFRNTQNQKILETNKARVDRTNEQVTSGYVAKTHEEYGSRNYDIIKARTQTSLQEVMLNDIPLMKNKGDHALNAIDGILDLMKDFSVRLKAEVDQGLDEEGFREYSAQILDQVQSLLNSRDSKGQYIFGGMNTKDAPVDVSALPMPAPASVVSDAYYQGSRDTFKASFTKDEGIVSFPVLANNPAFMKTLHAMKIASTTTSDFQPGSNATLLLIEAQDYIHEGYKEVSSLLADLGTTQRQLEAIQERLDDKVHTNNEFLAEFTEMDIMEGFVEKNLAMESFYLTVNTMMQNMKMTQQFMEIFN